MKAHDPDHQCAFPTTHWSQIYLAGDRERTEGVKALGEIVETYRSPLQAHLQFRFSVDLHQAGEWLDAFVEKRILEKDLLRQAQEKDGRFRGFLVTSLDRFVIDQIRHANRKQRKPEGGFESLSGLKDKSQTSTNSQNTDPGDRAWALSVLELARGRTEQFYLQKEKSAVWAVFLHGFYLPLRDGIRRPTDTELAAQFGFESPAQVSNTITTVKRKFGNCIRAVVSKYVPRATPTEVDDEIRDLMALLSGDAPD
jgi:hypothetical protein